MNGKQLWPPPSDEAPWAPSPEEIAECCEMIRNEWSEDEMLNRLRHDLRPLAWELSFVPTPRIEI